MSLTRHPFMLSLEANRAAREEWEKANPEIAAAWDDARAEAADRLKESEDAAAAVRRREAVRALCSDVGMPLRALAALPGLRETDAVAAMGGNAKAAIVLLGGPPGTGKSVAAVHAAHRAMVAAFAENPERVRESPERVAIFVRAVTLARSSAYGAEAQSLMGRLTSTRLLVLDDLGAEFQSPVWDMLLFEILDTRHGDMLPTVLTSNLGPADFAKRYGTRLLERIKEGGSAVFLNGQSMRGAP